MSGSELTFERHPSSYRHWRLDVDGDVATVTLAVDSEGGLRADYSLKLNTYDLGVDIELADARAAAPLRAPRGQGGRAHRRARQDVLRRRQHPDAGRVLPPPQGELLQVHQRDADRHRGRHGQLAARSGSPPSTAPPRAAATSWRSPATRSCSIDDRASAVSLPEVPLLGVLPGTGGLTRVIDKRHVRRDLRRRVRHPPRGRAGPAGARVGPGRRHRAPHPLRRRRRRSGPRPGRTRPTGRPTPTGVALTPLRRTATADGRRYRPRRGHASTVSWRRHVTVAGRRRWPTSPATSTPRRRR